jgi:hypothetical protein
MMASSCPRRPAVARDRRVRGGVSNAKAGADANPHANRSNPFLKLAEQIANC